MHVCILKCGIKKDCSPDSNTTALCTFELIRNAMFKWTLGLDYLLICKVLRLLYSYEIQIGQGFLAKRQCSKITKENTTIS